MIIVPEHPTSSIDKPIGILKANKEKRIGNAIIPNVKRSMI
jgi:hypothetical protein